MKKRRIVYVLKLLLLALPLLCLKIMPEPIYLVDAQVVKTAKQLPPDKDIAYKTYSQNKHAVLVVTNEYYRKNKNRLQNAVDAYKKYQKRLHSRRGNPIRLQTLLQIIFYWISFLFLTKMGEQLHTHIKKKKIEDLTFSERETTIRTLDNFQFCYGLLMPSVVMLFFVWLQWGKLTSYYWLGDTFTFWIGFIVYYALDIATTHKTLIISFHQLVVDKQGIRGRCAADASHPISFSEKDLNISWGEIDQAYIQKIEASWNEDHTKKTDAYSQLVFKRPQGSPQDLPLINIDNYDKSVLVACLNHYYAEYKQDSEARILEISD